MNEKTQWLLEHDFSDFGDIYCVGGGNTYLVKDELQDAGFKFSKLFGWHSGKQLPIPAGYKLIHFTFDELYEWDYERHRAFPYENIQTKILERINLYRPKDESEFIGEIDQRLYDLLVKIKKIKYFNYKYPYYIYYFDFQGNRLIWKTSKKYDFDIDTEIFLTGTIISHKEFSNIKFTEMKRCILKSI